MFLIIILIWVIFFFIKKNDFIFEDNYCGFKYGKKKFFLGEGLEGILFRL